MVFSSIGCSIVSLTPACDLVIKSSCPGRSTNTIVGGRPPRTQQHLAIINMTDDRVIKPHEL